MKTLSAALLAALAVLPALGCAVGGEPELDSTDEGGAAIALPAADQARILDLVNYPGTDVETLDVDAGLDARAAEYIIARRDGADGRPLTADDKLYASITELDAVPYVGDTAFSKLAAYAAVHPAPAAETVEGVNFAGWEAEAVIWGVNHASVDELDLDADLDRRAAQNLVAARPFATVTAMGPVSLVGPSALAKLKARAVAWWAASHAAGACDLNLTDRYEPSATDFDRMLDLATTGDYPFAEVVPLDLPVCMDLEDPGHQAALVAALVADPRIDWGYGPEVRPTSGGFVSGTTTYVALMRQARDAIEERLDSGSYVPTGNDGALFDRLPAVFQALTGGPESSPSRYFEVTLSIEAEECSQLASVLVDGRRLIVVHRFPRC